MAPQRTPDRFDFELDGRTITGLVAGSLVLLSLVFAVGVVAGQRLSTAPMTSPAAAGLDRLDMPPTPVAETTPFTFHGTLTEKQAPAPIVAAAPPPAPKPVAVAPPPIPPPAAVPAPEPVPIPVAEPVPDALPPPPVPEPPDEPSPEPPDGDAKFTVQFGSSANRAEAERLVGTLVDHGFQAFIEVADLPGKGRYFRVRVGRFPAKDAADALLRDVGEKHGLSGLVMPVR